MMTDRVYPSSKSTTTTPTKPSNTTTTTRLPPPPSKTPLPTTTRHPYRPNPTSTRRRTRRRSCFCLCYFWTTLIIILLLLITTIAGCIFYLLYHPKQPSFSLTSLKLIHFNLTTSNDDMTRVTSKFNLTLSTKNPNKKITFFYDPFTIKCFLDNTQLANGKSSFPTPFVSSPNNISIVKSTLTSNLLLLESETVNKIKADLKTKSGLKLKIVLDSEVRVKVESVKSKKVGIRVECDGIHSLVPKSGKNSTWVAANVSAAKCKIDLRVKIWKWTF